jgi:hypothetical protein
MLFDLMNVGISMLMTQLFKGSEGSPPAIAPPPAYTPPPVPTEPEIKETSSMTPDKDPASSNAYKKEEKRRILASLPKATKTVLDQKGEEGEVKKKTLLGSGGQGTTTLG